MTTSYALHPASSVDLLERQVQDFQLENEVLECHEDEIVKVLDHVTLLNDQLQGLLARRTLQSSPSIAQFDQEAFFYKEMLERMPSGVLLISMLDASILFANPMANQLFGYSSDELIGHNVAVLSQLNAQTVFSFGGDLHGQLAQDGLWTGEARVLCKVGMLKWCSVSVSKFEHAKYGPAWIAVYSDITKRVSLEQELIEQKVLQLEMRQNLRNLESLLLQSNLALPVQALPSDGRVPKKVPLSKRQQQILDLVSEGMTSTEIAAVLNISVATVTAHRRDIMRKLDLHSSVALTRYAIQQKV